MAPLAQALQVFRVGEQRYVATVRHDVINNGGSHSQTVLPTVAAKGLLEELRRPQLFSPDGQAVEPVPVLALSSLVLGLVSVTPTVTSYRRASRLAAWPQWLSCHGLSPPRQKKQKAGANNSASLALVIGPGSQSTGPHVSAG